MCKGYEKNKGKGPQILSNSEMGSLLTQSTSITKTISEISFFCMLHIVPTVSSDKSFMAVYRILKPYHHLRERLYSFTC